MKVGIISICGMCADKNKPPSVMLQVCYLLCCDGVL